MSQENLTLLIGQLIHAEMQIQIRKPNPKPKAEPNPKPPTSVSGV